MLNLKYTPSLSHVKQEVHVNKYKIQSQTITEINNP